MNEQLSSEDRAVLAAAQRLVDDGKAVDVMGIGSVMGLELLSPNEIRASLRSLAAAGLVEIKGEP
jgi:hypothetical protein